MVFHRVRGSPFGERVRVCNQCGYQRALLSVKDGGQVMGEF